MINRNMQQRNENMAGMNQYSQMGRDSGATMGSQIGQERQFRTGNQMGMESQIGLGNMRKDYMGGEMDRRFSDNRGNTGKILLCP